MKAKRYVARSSEIAARRLGNETMIMSGRDSTLFSLNEVDKTFFFSVHKSPPKILSSTCSTIST